MITPGFIQNSHHVSHAQRLIHPISIVESMWRVWSIRKTFLFINSTVETIPTVWISWVKHTPKAVISVLQNVFAPKVKIMTLGGECHAA